ncbi:MAG: SCO family protein [Burkholderiaceae bacterium]|nr:SCO family protein [Burkholderiaceae bacterium]
MRPEDRARRLLAAGAAAALLGAALVWTSVRRQDPAGDADRPARAASATIVDDRQPLPEFALRGTAGDVVRASLAGHWSMVFFGYTSCPDVCPGTLALMVELHRRLEAAERPKVLFVSVDPARDTPELLAAYVAAFDAGFAGASGTDESIAALAKHLGVSYRRNPPSPGGFYTVDHSASIFLIDPRARLKAVFSPPHDVDAMLADYRRLAR